jgi:hypothetical protein
MDSVIDACPVATALCAFMEGKQEWSGTATVLLTILENGASEADRRSRTWPRGARARSARIRRVAPALRRIGMTIEHTQEGHAKTRTITIKFSRPAGARKIASAPPFACATDKNTKSSSALDADATADANADPRAQTTDTDASAGDPSDRGRKRRYADAKRTQN